MSKPSSAIHDTIAGELAPTEHVSDEALSTIVWNRWISAGGVRHQGPMVGVLFA